MIEVLIIGIVFFLLGMSFGWRSAHLTVAEECEKLGRFYVLGTTYECQKIIVVTKTEKVEV
jgi:hypothetical protein